MSSVILLDDDSSDEVESTSNAGSVKPPEDSEIEKIREVTVEERPYDDTETVSTVTAENSNGDEEKPLLDLMKDLINYNGKQNTKLTNNQLVEILKTEFDINVANLHFISVEIYINVLKKFLKDWPQWDEFDQVMHETRCMNDNDEVDRILEREYQTLKNYLAAILKASQPFAREAAQKLKRSLQIPESSRAVPGDVIMEINCTREQLNTLFFRKPHPEYKSTIFNLNSPLPSKITLNLVTFETILNSCYVNLTINMACFKYKRELTHNFKHMLVNKKLKQVKRDPPLNPHLQTPKTVKYECYIDKKDLKALLDKIQRSNQYGSSSQADFEALLRVINYDFKELAEGKLGVPCTFRHYLSRYPYVRYLYKDVAAHSEKYDIQLEEKASPMLKFHINRVNFFASAVNTELNWLKMECSICQLKFVGTAGIESLKSHFRERHQHEPNWSCVHCDREFTNTELQRARWYHKCENTEIETE